MLDTGPEISVPCFTHENEKTRHARKWHLGFEISVNFIKYFIYIFLELLFS